MEIARHFWTVPTRPCSFSLCLQGGSVFADFDIDPDGRVFLIRISFDGYGCCDTGGNISRMAMDDSRTLSQLVETDDVDCDEVRQILRRYFQLNKEVIWRDALEEHELINIR